MTSRAIVRTTLPFDAGLARGLSIYARRVIIICSVACIVVAVGGGYALYRVATYRLETWAQVLVALVVLQAAWVVLRWRAYRDLPTGLDQVIALMLFVLCSPVYLFGAVYLSVRPAMFRRVQLVGRRGRVVTATEYRPAKGPEEFVAFSPDAFAFISLLPSMITGQVRFRGRPLLRLDSFCSAGPVALADLGRAPGIFLAHHRRASALDGSAIPRYVRLWQQESTRPADEGDALLVIYLATTKLKGAPGHRPARVLLPFVVAPEHEGALRARVLRQVGLEDLILGRASHAEALIRAAWIAWGEPGHPQPPAHPHRRPQPRPSGDGRPVPTEGHGVGARRGRPRSS